MTADDLVEQERKVSRALNAKKKKCARPQPDEARLARLESGFRPFRSTPRRREVNPYRSESQLPAPFQSAPRVEVWRYGCCAGARLRRIPAQTHTAHCRTPADPPHRCTGRAAHILHPTPTRATGLLRAQCAAPGRHQQLPTPAQRQVLRRMAPPAQPMRRRSAARAILCVLLSRSPSEPPPPWPLSRGAVRSAAPESEWHARWDTSNLLHSKTSRRTRTDGPAAHMRRSSSRASSLQVCQHFEPTL